MPFDRTITEQQARDALRVLGQHAGKPLQHAIGLSFPDVKKEWRRLAKTHHPDKGGSADVFKKCSEAYNQLETYCTRQGNTLPDPRATAPSPPPPQPRTRRRARPRPQPRAQAPQPQPGRAESPMGGRDPVAEREQAARDRQQADARERRRQVSDMLDGASRTIWVNPASVPPGAVPIRTVPPFGSQPPPPPPTPVGSPPVGWPHTHVPPRTHAPPPDNGVYKDGQRVPYGREAAHPEQQRPSNPMGAFGSQNVGPAPAADDFLAQAAGLFRNAFNVSQAIQQPSSNGLVQDLVDIVGGMAQTPAWFYVTHEELARHSRIAGTTPAIISGTLHQPGAMAQQGSFHVQMQGNTATVNGVPCTVHVQ